MIENEYLTVRELSVKHNLTSRHIRRIITKFYNESGTKGLIIRNKNNHWLVHRVIEYRFQPKRKRKNKYYAVTIDPCHPYTVKEIDTIMNYLFEQLNSEDVEINYVVETKAANNQNHVHCYIKCTNRKKVIEAIKLGFSRVNYLESLIFDLEGWRNYITKQNKQIITLKKVP